MFKDELDHINGDITITVLLAIGREFHRNDMIILPSTVTCEMIQNVGNHDGY